MKKQSSEKYALSFGLGFLSLFVVLLPLVCLDKGYFIYYGDFVGQQLPFYHLANETVRDGGLFGWSWYTDLGSSFLGSYAFYLAGSPFFWLTVLLPEQWVLYAVPWLLCLKHGLASVTAYAYIRRFVKNPDSAVIGGLLYAFSGFQIFNIFFNHFQDVTALFPLMLIAMEELINHNRKGWFAAIVAVMAMLNYFFFAGQVVFLILYFIIRCRCQDFHISLKKFLALAMEAVIGVCIACVMLVPAALAVILNNRVSSYLFGQDMILYSDKTRIIRIIQSFFMIPDPPARTNLFQTKYAKWASMGGYLPLFSMTGVISFMSRKKKHWASMIVYICILCAFVPVLNSSFYMLNASYYARWYYMPILLMAMMTAYVLDNQECDWKNGLKISAVMLGIFGVTALLPTKDDDGKIQILQFALIPAYFLVQWMVSALNLVGTHYLYRMRRKRQFIWKKAVLLTSAACVVCTGTVVYFGKAIGANSGDYIREGIHGRENLTVSYVTDEDDYFRVDVSKDYDNYPMFWGLSSMRCFQSVVSPSIMNFYQSIGIERDVSSRAEPEHYTLRGLFSVKYYFDKIKQTSDEEQKPFEMAGFVYDRTENGFEIYKNNYFIPLGFTYDKFVTEETMTEKQNSVREKMLIHALILNQEQAEKYQDIITEIENVSAVSLSKQEYLNACEKHQAESCYDFVYDSGGFSAKIDLENPKLVFFSIPYDDGWSAEINGKPVEIENVSGGFMAVRCESGQNEITFSYHLAGLKIGFCITLAGILLLMLYLMFGKKLFTDKPDSRNYDYLSRVRASDAYIAHLKYIENSERSTETHEYQSSE
ncbi:MAG: YfhO family protein [Oscillospiraceae bacterium]|nr:YfhO family protein [Oscillospiraceae bacterium]